MDADVRRRSDQGQPIGQAIFDVGSKFELSIGRNRNEVPSRIERPGRIRKSHIRNDLPVAGRQQPGAAPRRLDAGAGEPAGGGNEREGKNAGYATESPFTRQGEATTMGI